MTLIMLSMDSLSLKMYDLTPKSRDLMV
jgi:hypothetical protein